MDRVAANFLKILVMALMLCVGVGTISCAYTQQSKINAPYTARISASSSVEQEEASYLLERSVLIRILEDDNEGVLGWATGIVVDNIDGNVLILTAGHVCADVLGNSMGPLEIWSTTTEYFTNARAIAADLKTDLCAITAPGELPAVEIGSLDYPYYYGTPVHTVGAPYGIYPVPARGQLGSMSPGGGLVVSTAPIVPGFSGGGVLDGRALIGISILVQKDYVHGGYVVTLAKIYPFLEFARGILTKDSQTDSITE